MENKFKYIEIVKDEFNVVVKRINVTGYSERRAEKIEDGFNFNLNHNKYTTKIEEYSSAQPDSDEHKE